MLLQDVGMRWTKEQGASPEAKEQEETSSNALVTLILDN